MTLYKITFIFMIVFVSFLDLNNKLKAYDPDGGSILFTRIPYYLEGDEEIKQIREDGKRKLKFIYINLIAIAVIVGYYYDPLIVLLIVTLLMITIMPFFLQKDIDAMRTFKAKNVRNESKKKLIDLDLINEKDKFMVKKSSYIPVLLIYLIAIGLGFYFDKTYPKWLWILLGLCFMGSDILIDRILMKNSIIIYTDDSAINLSLNEKIAGSKARLLYKKTLVNSILFLGLVGLMLYDPFSVLSFILFFTGLTFVITYTFYKYKRIGKNPILDPYYKQGYDDQVEYYTAWGYNNKEDRRLLVPRRIGVGSDINYGTLSGKIYYGVTVLVILGLTIFVSTIMTKPMTYTYKIDDKEINITSSQLYKDDIKIEDIESIKLLDEFPKGRLVRTSGSALEKTSTGNYKIENYGKARLYIYNDVDKTIEVKTKDKIFLFNENTPMKTEKLYKKLSNYIF